MVARVNHKYREEIVVPLVAISNNICFLLERDKERIVITADDVKCNVVDYKEVHIACDEFESLIKRLYNLDAYTFIKKWYSKKREMDSMFFVYIKMKEVCETEQL
jgi:hypothetical protein